MKIGVDVRSLVKIYGGSHRALDGINLEVKAGQVFALLGPNGAGKTTLIRILTTQIRPTSGSARIFGMDVEREGGEIRKAIGYVPQEMSVWTDITGYENLLIYAKIFGMDAKERENSITELLETMDLDKVSDNLVSTYSGGMIRRLEIACAILTRPKILFLDEPTIGLDPSGRKAVWERLVSFKKEFGMTIFFNTHYMDEADQYSDQIAIISHGRIIKKGTAEELKRSVGGELILLEVEGKMPEKTLGRIRSMKQVDDVVLNGLEIRVASREAEKVLPKVMDLLRRERVTVNKASISKLTLDDVFLKYAPIRKDIATRMGEVRSTRGRITG